MRRKPRMKLVLAFALLAAVSCLAAPANAHPLAPSLLELREGQDGTVAVRFRTPRVQSVGAALQPELPEACRARSAPT